MNTLKNILEKTNQPNLIISLTKLKKIKKLAKCHSKGANLFELRADLISTKEWLEVDAWLKEASEFQIPILFTLRNKEQGGLFADSEAKRLEIIKKYSLSEAVVAIDVEQNSVILKEVIEFGKKHQKTIIASNHFFKLCPNQETINQLMNDFQSTGADFFKLAVNLNSQEEFKQISEFLLKQSSKNSIILVGMGAFSLLSRISFPALGSLASFCHLGQNTAPNQPSFKTLKKLNSSCYLQ